MKFLSALVIVTAAVCVVATATNAGTFRALTLIWVKIKAEPGEARWHACRRVYQRDVYHVRRGPGNTMWCHIDHSRIYDYGGRHQSFNLQ